MNDLKLVLVTFLLCFTHFSGFAQTNAVPSQDPRVALKQELAAVKSLKAAFTQAVYDEGDVVYEAQGQLYLAKPGKVRWETAYPDEALMIADGQKIYNVDSFVEQVTVFSQRQAIENNPIVLLTTLNDEIWNEFTITKLALAELNKNIDATSGYSIKALSPDAQITSLTIQFRNELIASISTLDAQGQTSQLIFDKPVLNDTLPEALFVPSFPESFTVDDQS